MGLVSINSYTAHHGPTVTHSNMSPRNHADAMHAMPSTCTCEFISQVRGAFLVIHLQPVGANCHDNHQISAVVAAVSVHTTWRQALRLGRQQVPTRPKVTPTSLGVTSIGTRSYKTNKRHQKASKSMKQVKIRTSPMEV